MEKARRERIRVAARQIEFKRLKAKLKPESKRRMTHCSILQAAIDVSVSILISYMSILTHSPLQTPYGAFGL